ncbi:MAG: methyltransferase [bacterium]
MIDKNKVRKHFNKSAATYDEYAGLQKRIAEELVEQVKSLGIKPRSILDIGAGTGYVSLSLAKVFPQSKVVSFDIAHGMNCRSK